MSDFVLPPMGFGPGSQPEPGTEDLSYTPMPSDMRTFVPRIPEIESSAGRVAALAVLGRIAEMCEAAARGETTTPVALDALEPDARRIVAETLGEGEVAMRIHGVPATAVQEAVFAGVWSLHRADHAWVAVGAVPADAVREAFVPRRPVVPGGPDRRPTVVNAPPILAELLDKSAAWTGEAPPHVINLTLLPHTEDDLQWLEAALGQGSVEILSRGYGNCRVTATALPKVWRVQFFNSMDVLILDTFEVAEMPEVVRAAPEDLDDSAARVREVMEAIR